MKKIVAATDFSVNSINAVKYAVDLCLFLKADLCLIHVSMIPLPINEIPVSDYSIEESIKQTEREIESLKNDLLKKNEGRDLKINTVVRSGDVVKEIKDYCNSIEPFALVLGSETTTGFERLFTSGVTIEAVRDILWPLVVVPPSKKFTQFRKIGVATDFNHLSANPHLDEIRELTKTFQAELHIIHVRQSIDGSMTGEKILDYELTRDKLQGLKTEYHFLSGKSVEQTLKTFAENNNFDLLVIFPKKHNNISGLFLHSYSKNMVMDCHVPIMSMHD
jgi:nucleotide-binding universal stress UspA family protein